MERLGAVSGTTGSAGVWQDPNNPWILQSIFSFFQDVPDGRKWVRRRHWDIPWTLCAQSLQLNPRTFARGSFGKCAVFVVLGEQQLWRLPWLTPPAHAPSGKHSKSFKECLAVLWLLDVSLLIDINRCGRFCYAL